MVVILHRYGKVDQNKQASHNITVFYFCSKSVIYILYIRSIPKVTPCLYQTDDTQGVVCPGKQRASQLPLDTSSACNHETYPSSSESSFDPMTDVRDLESSFYFSDCESADQASVVDSELLSSGESVDSDALHVEEMLEERLSSDNECSLGEEDEIWEDDSDPETSP